MGRLFNNQIQHCFREANRYAAALARSRREQLENFVIFIVLLMKRFNLLL
jgi:hypothetical protein